MKKILNAEGVKRRRDEYPKFNITFLMVIRQTINEKRASIIKIKGNGYSNFEKLLRGKGCSTPFRYVTGG